MSPEQTPGVLVAERAEKREPTALFVSWTKGIRVYLGFRIELTSAFRLGFTPTCRSGIASPRSGLTTASGRLTRDLRIGLTSAFGFGRWDIHPGKG